MQNQIISLRSDKLFNVVINGNQKATIGIILVHGFGVRSDSRGLFSDTENKFETNFLIFRPDFAVMEEKFIRAIPISKQADRLKVVINYVDKKYKLRKLILIGHSQGCMVIGKNKPNLCQIFLLAPPIVSPYKNFINSKGWTYPKSYLNIKGESCLTRSDGTQIFVEKDFWKDFPKFDSVKKLYLDLVKNNDVYMVIPANDYVKQKIPKGINGFIIENANHDFKNETRKVLIKKIKERIKVD